MSLSRTIALAFAALLLGFPAAAQLGNKPVQVINPPGEVLAVTHPGGVEVTNFPATQTVDGTVNVGNLPATQTVDGSVNVGNFPSFPTSQTVDGAVNIGNFPASQTVDGTVNIGNLPTDLGVSGTVSVGNVVDVQAAEGVGHLGQPILEHVKLTVSAWPLLAQFGLIRFDEKGSTGGSNTPTVADGVCLVILDIEIVYRSVELIGPGTIGGAPFSAAEFQYGLTNGTGFLRFGDLVGVTGEGLVGRLSQSFGAGLVLTLSGFDETATEFALKTGPIDVSGVESIPNILGGHATGYRTPC